MKFAVASSDGENIDLHFGKASSICIFDYDDEDIELLDKYELDIDEDKHHQGSIIVNFLNNHNIKTIFVLQIGFKSKIKVDDAGIKVVVDEGSIKEAVLKYVNHLKFMEKPIEF
ncbi:NifB/NifX family molybdenum-iron cluster-binding protein [Methanobrevibacter sp.]